MSSPDNLSQLLERMTPQRHSTPQQIADLLGAEILDGALKPGERLREARVAESFAVSRNTVREALRVLERKGLVRHTPHRGAEVTRLTEEDVSDVYRARAVLEQSGAMAIEPEAARKTLLPEVERIEAAAAAGDVAALLEHDFAFHRALVAAIGSRHLEEHFSALQRELRLALSQLDSHDPLPQIEEHREIAEALVAGRRPVAEAVLGRHLGVAAERLSTMIARRF